MGCRLPKMEPGELEPICDSCRLQSPKYTCPACQMKSCCLACVKAHKAATSCTGIRPKQTFLKLAEMTDDSFTLDSRLIEDAKLETERAARAHSVEPDKKALTRQGTFRWMLQERRLLVKCLPSSFTRHQENKSRVFKDGAAKRVKWTLEIKHESTGRRELIHNIDESVKLSEIIPQEGDLFVLEEGIRKAGKMKPLDRTQSLKEQLVDLTIIEFPIFLVKNKQME